VVGQPLLAPKMSAIHRRWISDPSMNRELYSSIVTNRRQFGACKAFFPKAPIPPIGTPGVRCVIIRLRDFFTKRACCCGGTLFAQGKVRFL
jgi:hypothetical protein